jgi:preprotein translocase subunit SecY
MEKIRQIFTSKDLLKKILFVMFALFLFRLAAHIPVPGPDSVAVKAFLAQAFASNSVLSFMDIFSGGGISQFSIVMMGLGPYITASIIIQLLTLVFPMLEEISKDGEEGRRKLNQYTRYLALPLAYIEGYGAIRLLQFSASQIGKSLIGTPSLGEWFVMLTCMAGGTFFLMWIGELVTEKGIGNGISLIIFAGIVAKLPQTVGQSIQKIFIPAFDSAQLTTTLAILAAAIAIIVAIIFVTEGQRKIPISYAKKMRGDKLYGGIDTFLPIRLNMAGVIPIIFAGAFMNIPVMIGFFAKAKIPWIASSATWIQSTFNQNGYPYGVLFFILVFGFTFFSTFLYFKPKDVAENLQKNGGFIPGFRPGTQTANYLNWLINRTTLWGALFLGIIAILPFIATKAFNISNLMIGGTSLLIVVSVAIEVKNQIDAQLVIRSYDQI